MDIDECETVITESSSGIDDGDVTIICQDPSIQCQIEDGLTEHHYKVVQSLIGGRTKVKNLTSCVKHSLVRVVVFTNPQLNNFLQILEPLVGNRLPFSSTLILCHSSVSPNKLGSYMSEFQLLRLDTDVNKNVEKIRFYIEATKEADRRGISDTKEKNRLFAFLLVCTSLDLENGSFYSDVLQQFDKTHGSFLKLRVGALKQFLRGHKMIRWDGSDYHMLVVNEEGIRLIEKCAAKIGKYLSSNSLPQEVDRKSVQPTVVQQQKSRKPVEVEKSSIPAVESAQDKKESASLEQQKFYKHLLDPQYAFFLITSAMNYHKEFQSLSRIPFMKVFDFDPYSRKRGLLNSVEEAFEKERRLTKSTLDQTVERVTENVTQWLFMKGMTERLETVFEGSAYKWQHKFRENLQENCEHLLEYCALEKPAVFVVFWYNENQKEIDFLKSFLYQVSQVFSNPFNHLSWEIILCIPPNPSDELKFQDIIETYNITENLKVVVVDHSTLASWLADFPVATNNLDTTVRVPKRIDEKTLDEIVISKQRLNWLSPFLEILPIALCQDDHKSASKRRVGEDFARGGLLEWNDFWNGEAAVERQIQEDVCEFIKAEIDQCRSIVHVIAHAPGGGGTTFGRQLLWSLRKSAPCCVLVPTTYFPLAEVLERIEVLHELTNLPVVILVDGRSDLEVERLFECRKYAVVIIHVQRKCTGVKESLFGKGTSQIAGKVTPCEANNLSQFFGAFSAKNAPAFVRLNEAVVEGHHVEVFEFGLAAFNHEFKGVRRYVQGYMGRKSVNLFWWQKIISYLSLLKFYGQSGMYGEVFRSLIPGCEKHATVAQVTSGSYFIIELKKIWKINHHAVAREVLEFALAAKGEQKIRNPACLSGQAQHSLHTLVIDFIRHVKKAVGGKPLDKIVQSLQHMVTKRDYTDLDATDGLGKRWHLSRLLEDITVDENKILVLQELAKAFPKHAEFHAHLGRLCSFYKRFAEAEESLNEALRLREKQIKGRTPKHDDMMARFHNMFGYSYLRKVVHFQKKLEEAHEAAVKSVQHFAEGRKLASYNQIYGYTGEVKVRLQMVEMFQKAVGIQKAFSKSVDRVGQFVQDSHAICDQLLLECYHYSNKVKQNQHQFFDLVKRYYACYLKVPIVYKHDDDHVNIPLIRSRIAAIKMKHKPKNSMRKTDDITAANDIKEVVKLLNDAIEESFSMDQRHVYISVEMQEWLYAIRHRLVSDEYDLTMVWKRIEQWEERNEFGFSTFYLYVVYFLLALFSSGSAQRRQFWKNKNELYKKLAKNHDKYIVRGKEVLTNHKEFTIRKIVPRRHLGEWDNQGKTWGSGTEQLKVCTGTIVKSHLPLHGFISIDLDNPIPDCKVNVFFSPKKHNLYGRRFEQQATRVEFFIAFNTNNGAEAESVKEMNRKMCSTCKMKTDVLTLNQPQSGRCLICRGTTFVRD